MEWHANGFDPDRQHKNQDFAKAIKQTAPIFETERLGNQRYSVMNGIDALVISPMDGKHVAESEEAKTFLTKNWRLILRGEDADFRVIGVEANASEANIWVFHAESQTLFMLYFVTSSENDDWLKRPIYRFV